MEGEEDGGYTMTCKAELHASRADSVTTQGRGVVRVQHTSAVHASHHYGLLDCKFHHT
jgi:hypothetical protein